MDALDMGLGSSSEPDTSSLGDMGGLMGSSNLQDLDMGLMSDSGGNDDGLDDGGTSPTLSAGQIYNDLAELKIDSPKVIRIRTGVHPFPARITIANAGEGPMPGTVSTDAPWIQISPGTLDPTRRRQVIEALVEPDAMPGNTAKATITVETDHGEIQTVTIDALKYVISPVMMLVGALGAVGIAFSLSAAYLFGYIGSALDLPTSTIFTVKVDPQAGEVYIDETLVADQGSVSLVNGDGFPIGSPFRVRVELDGFEPFTREGVTVQKGDEHSIEVDLILRDPLDFEPKPGMKEAALDTDAVDTVLDARGDDFNNCFTRHLRMLGPFTARIDVSATVADRGFIHGVLFGEKNFESPPVETCIKRQLRALKFPLIPGDYARFDHTFISEIPVSSSLKEEVTP